MENRGIKGQFLRPKVGGKSIYFLKFWVVIFPVILYEAAASQIL